MPKITDAIDTDLIEEVCNLPDDVYRNQWITYVYDGLSRRVATSTKGGANWFTFARWSSFTVGENLRLDKPSAAFDELLDANWMFRLARGRLRQMQRDLRMRGDRAMPRILALGNKLVFDEIAYATVEFLDWYDATKKHDLAAWRAYRATIEPTPTSDLFQSCDVEWLREGLESYFQASIEPDKNTRARLVLRGNVLLAAYEQWRLQPIVDLALDLLARHLVEFENMDLHAKNGGPPRAVLRRRGTPWAFRHRSPAVEWFTDQYAMYLTTRVMAWQGRLTDHKGSIFLGQALPDPPRGKPKYPAALRSLKHDELRIVEVFDRSGGTQAGRRSRSWVRYNDRMNFIVNLFRAAQDDKKLFDKIDGRETRIVALDLSDENLARLRSIGDTKVDTALKDRLTKKGVDPRVELTALMTDKKKKREFHDGDGSLPRWADPAQLELGQRFLCRHGLEIGSSLFFASLPYSYSAGPGAHVLMRTAELTTGNTSRRLAETGQMLLDLMTVDEAKTPLQAGTVASNAIRGVRLFHAVVRAMLLADQEDRWDAGVFGTPVNQEDLLGTLVVFTVVVVDALEELGITFDDERSKQERDAYIHLWLVVGHLLGIDYSKLRSKALPNVKDAPLTLEELRFLQIAIFRRQSGPSLDGQTLTASLLEATSSRLRWIMKGYPAAATRALLGRDLADALAVPPDGPARLVFNTVQLTTRALALPGPSVRIGDRCLTVPGPRDAVAGVARVATKQLYRRWIREHKGGSPPWRLDAAAGWNLDRTTDSFLDLVDEELQETYAVVFRRLRDLVK